MNLENVPGKLLDSADLLFADDGHPRYHDRQQGDEIRQHAGDKVEPAVQIRVEPDSASGNQPLCGRKMPSGGT